MLLRKGLSLPIVDELQNRRRELWVTGCRPLRRMRGATYLYDAQGGEELLKVSDGSNGWVLIAHNCEHRHSDT